MLVGKLPEVADDSNPLMWLDVSNNRLSGSLPRSWYFLESLTRLYVDRNQLTGTIGKDIGLLKKLNDLWLNDNMFSEGIPLELGMMSDLGKYFGARNCYVLERNSHMVGLALSLLQRGYIWKRMNSPEECRFSFVTYFRMVYFKSCHQIVNLLPIHQG